MSAARAMAFASAALSRRPARRCRRALVQSSGLKLAAHLIDSAARKTFNAGMKRILAALLLLILAAPALGQDGASFKPEKLDELGIDKETSRRAQKIAKLPPAHFEALKAGKTTLARVGATLGMSLPLPVALIENIPQNSIRIFDLVQSQTV